MKSGVSVILKTNINGKPAFLMGKRKGSHGAGSWSFPGGHIDPGENIVDCAKREILEETGLEINNLAALKITCDHFKKEDLKYITYFIVADIVGNTDPQLLEPDKCEGWEWLTELPEPLFLPIKNFQKQDSKLLLKTLEINYD